MEIGLILQIAGVAIIVVSMTTLMDSLGKKEYGNWITFAGFLIIIVMLVFQLGRFIDEVKSVFMYL
ncbi:MAG: stage III sporulation protein AC [Bacilli bacterium]